RQAPAEDRWLRGADKIAEYIDAPRSRVYALASAGRIPVHRDGSTLIARTSELDKWLMSGGGRRPWIRPRSHHDRGTSERRRQGASDRGAVGANRRRARRGDLGRRSRARAGCRRGRARPPLLGPARSQTTGRPAGAV